MPPVSEPARDCVADRGGKITTSGGAAEGVVQPGAHLAKYRCRPFLAHPQALIQRTAAHVVLDRIECLDAPQRLGGDRRLARRMQVEELAAHMRPAAGLDHPSAVSAKRVRPDALPRFGRR